jgi:hypothetical protein
MSQSQELLREFRRAERRARCFEWLVLAVAIALLLWFMALCGHAQELPPLPGSQRSEGRGQRSEIRSPKAASLQVNAMMVKAAPAIIIAPPKPQIINLAWNYQPFARLTNCVTILQFSTNLTSWTQIGSVPCALTNSFSITNPPPSFGFFHAYTLDAGTGLTSK